MWTRKVFSTFTNKFIACPEYELLKKKTMEMLNGQGQVVLIESTRGQGSTRLLYEFSGWLAVEHSEIDTVVSACVEKIGVEILNEEFKELVSKFFPNFRKFKGTRDIIAFLLARNAKYFEEFFNREYWREVAIKKHTDTIPLPTESKGYASDKFREEYAHGGEEVIYEYIIKSLPTTEQKEQKADIEKQNIMAEKIRSNPVVIILDDAHWSDIYSIDFFLYLAYHIQRLKVMVVLSYNPEELAISMIQNKDKGNIRQEGVYFNWFVNKIREEKLGEIITMSDFDKDTSQELVSSILPQLSTMERESVSNTLFSLVKGNPGFTLSYIELFEKTEVIKKIKQNATELDIAKMKETVSSHVPERISNAVLKKLGVIEENPLKVLRAAAIVGNNFSYNWISDAAGIPHDRFLDAIDTLISLKLVKGVEGTADKYEFYYPVIPMVIIQNMNPQRLVNLHLQIATSIEKSLFGQRDFTSFASALFGHESVLNFEQIVPRRMTTLRTLQRAKGQGADENLFEGIEKMAYHYSCAQHPEKAAKYNIFMGEYLLGEFQYERAAHFFRNALQHLTPLQEKKEIKQQLISVLTCLEHISYMELELDNATGYNQHLITLADELQNSRLKTDALLNLARIKTETGEIEDALIHIFDAQKIADENRDIQGLAMAQLLKGEALLAKSSVKDCLYELEKGESLCEKIGDILDYASILVLAGEANFILGNFSESRQLIGKGQAIFEKIHDNQSLARGYLISAYLSIVMHNVEDAAEYLERVKEISFHTSYLKYQLYYRVAASIAAFLYGTDHFSFEICPDSLVEKLAMSRLTRLHGTVMFGNALNELATGDSARGEHQIKEVIEFFEKHSSVFEATMANLILCWYKEGRTPWLTREKAENHGRASKKGRILCEERTSILRNLSQLDARGWRDILQKQPEELHSRANS
ncbi:MAG: hypothetical protein QW728_05110 [Thermoplasmata archaeon]